MPALRFFRTLLALGAAILAFPCGAQSTGELISHQIIGTVRRPDGTPARGALVAAMGMDVDPVVTDSDGRFSFPKPLSDSARLWATMFGYRATAPVRVGDLPRDPGNPDRAVAEFTLKEPLPSRPLDIIDDTVLDAYLTPVAPAAGMRPLLSASRKQGDQELRLYVGGGIFVPENLIVLRNHGGAIAGTVWLWWRSPRGTTTVPDEDRQTWDETVDSTETLWKSHAADFGCPHAEWHDYGRRRRGDDELLGRRMLVCRATFSSEPDWRTLWNRLDSLGVWTLPDQDELPASPYFTTDGTTLWVEALDGRGYRTYAHANPDAYPWPESKRAAAMLKAASETMRGVLYNRSSR